MSEESMETLNSEIKSGMESVFGKPWWYDPKLANPANHYDGPIPVEDALAFFESQAERARVFVSVGGRIFEATDYVAMVPDNADVVFGIHSKGYKEHQFRAWLVEGPLKLVNGKTGISSLGKLRKGARAWCQISVPETWKTPQGVEFRSNLLNYSALDGSLASTFKLTDQFSICDNTVAMALRSSGLVYRVKHTANSEFRVADAQAAFQLIETHAKETAEAIATLCEWQVTDAQFERFMSQLVPMPEIAEKDINKRDYSTRNATIAANKREKLNELYRADGRVEPWKGTAFGVLQMVNTFNTHMATQRNVDHRALRNMENVISGKSAEQDNEALALLAKICDRELVAA